MKTYIRFIFLITRENEDKNSCLIYADSEEQARMILDITIEKEIIKSDPPIESKRIVRVAVPTTICQRVEFRKKFIQQKERLGIKDNDISQKKK